MFLFLLVSCICLCLITSVYLVIFSPYRIRNWHGFLLLFATFAVHSILISIVPFCQIYLLYFLVFIDIDSFNPFFHPILVFYCVIESLFYLFTIEEARLLNHRSLPRRISVPNNYKEQLIDRICTVYEKSNEDFRVCFGEWFDGTDQSSWNSIYQENILEYLTMATYGLKYWDEMTAEQQEYIKDLFYNGYLKKYPQQCQTIQAGYNDQIKLKHPYRDAIQYTHYPFVKYLLFACVRTIMILVLSRMGYRYHVIDNVTFYIRKSPKKTRSPAILFLHGLSLGTNTYITFIHRLNSLDRTIILLDIPSASMRLHTEVFPMATIVSSIQQLLHFLRQKSFTTISHSYGTLIHSCLIKQCPELIANQVSIFIDPVCFLLFDYRYLKNFIYRQPRSANQLLLHSSCTEDLYSIYAIERHLCWYECNLWSEDIFENHLRIHVFFSEDDDIIPVAFVDEYLRKSQINTTVFPKFKHGHFLISSKFQDEVLNKVHQLEKENA